MTASWAALFDRAEAYSSTAATDDRGLTLEAVRVELDRRRPDDGPATDGENGG